MAQTQYRANLSAKDFVFSSQQWGRTIIVKQFDQNFSRQIVSATDPDKDIGIPQIYYCHNVMPAAQGFQSVGIKQVIPGVSGTNNIFQVIPFSDTASGNTGWLMIVDNGVSSYGVWYILTTGASWTFLQNVTPVAFYKTLKITTANVNGQTYILFPGTICYIFDGGSFTPVALQGLDITTIQGITQSFGYMIAWSATAVAWSSTIDPTDFTPSLITGAGGGQISPLSGDIVSIERHTFGFIAFSTTNCVAAVYSGNSRFPFNFREIIGGGGLTPNRFLSALDSESGNLYSYTSAGLQLISITQASIVFPELTNYIGGGLFEDFDDATLQFIETTIDSGSMEKMVRVISERYLTISYGTVPNSGMFSHALVYDIAMKRWGKIKCGHVEIFEFANNVAVDAARISLGILDANGFVYTVDFSAAATTGGVMVLGKYQHTRNRFITLQEVDSEIVDSTACKIYDYVTLDGKTFLPPVQLVVAANDGSGNPAINPTYNCRLTGLNHSLLFFGKFQLDSLVLSYTPNGRR